MKLIAPLLLVLVVCGSTLAQDSEFSPEELELIRETNENVSAFLEGDYERVTQAYEAMNHEKGNVSLMIHKMANESYIKLAELQSEDSSNYIQKANEVYERATKWSGKMMVAERWDSVVIKKRSESKEKFTIVEQQPEFPGGMQAFYNYVGQNMQYPSEARRMGVEGRVYVQFIVNKDGSVDAVNTVKGIGSGCDEEAERAIAMAPNFIPGKQDGKPVYVKMVLPIYFKLTGASPKAKKQKKN